MERTALLVIDAQNEMFDETNPVYKWKELLENLQSLIEKARSSDVPVIFVQHNDKVLVNGTHDWEIHPSIRPIEGDTVIQKWTPDSFHETNLQDELETKGIQHLVITGNQTEMCVDTTKGNIRGKIRFTKRSIMSWFRNKGIQTLKYSMQEN